MYVSEVLALPFDAMRSAWHSCCSGADLSAHADVKARCPDVR